MIVLTSSDTVLLAVLIGHGTQVFEFRSRVNPGEH